MTYLHVIMRFSILFFAFITSMQVHGQMKRTRSFDLNKTPSPPSSPDHSFLFHRHGQQNDDLQSPTENARGAQFRTQFDGTNTESANHETFQITNDKQNTPNKVSRQWKRKPRIIKTGKTDEQREIERLSAKKYRDGIKARKLAGTMTESDIRYFENMKKRKKKYQENHPGDARTYYVHWRKKNLEYDNERSKKWRSENLERCLERERQYRERNQAKLRQSRIRQRYKNEPKQI